jgi:hypothetical protein
MNGLISFSRVSSLISAEKLEGLDRFTAVSKSEIKKPMKAFEETNRESESKSFKYNS